MRPSLHFDTAIASAANDLAEAALACAAASLRAKAAGGGPGVWGDACARADGVAKAAGEWTALAADEGKVLLARGGASKGAGDAAQPRAVLNAGVASTLARSFCGPVTWACLAVAAAVRNVPGAGKPKKSGKGKKGGKVKDTASQAGAAAERPPYAPILDAAQALTTAVGQVRAVTKALKGAVAAANKAPGNAARMGCEGSAWVLDVWEEQEDSALRAARQAVDESDEAYAEHLDQGCKALAALLRR